MHSEIAVFIATITKSSPATLLPLDDLWGTEGRAAALAATEKGLPALAGLDPLISAECLRQTTPDDDIENE